LAQKTSYSHDCREFARHFLPAAIVGEQVFDLTQSGELTVNGSVGLQPPMSGSKLPMLIVRSSLQRIGSTVRVAGIWRWIALKCHNSKECYSFIAHG
jgi:hypothetical protein